MRDHTGGVVEHLAATIGAVVVSLALRADLIESDLEGANLLIDDLINALLMRALLDQLHFECLANFHWAVDFATTNTV